MGEGALQLGFPAGVSSGASGAQGLPWVGLLYRGCRTGRLRRSRRGMVPMAIAGCALGPLHARGGSVWLDHRKLIGLQGDVRVG